ncbi:unnamed protein product [Parnassius apollo]|uniref:(apollo) hypothetical protein n=1 Tax=Parnassius apollo TaxID=110799 RepID=A0A8S3XXM2_PARAO|nr:unnamed protein product [Parnassius apollo]
MQQDIAQQQQDMLEVKEDIKGNADNRCEAVITTVPMTQSGKEITTGTEIPALSERERRATERSKAKGATTLQKRERLSTSTDCLKTKTDINQLSNAESGEWKTVVNQKKVRKTQPKLR